MKFLNLTLTMTTLLTFSHAMADSYFDRKVNGVKVYDLILKQDVPEKALRRVFEFLDINGKHTVVLKDKDRDGRRIIVETEKVTIKDDYASIIDYSKPSNQPRLYLMNLKTGGVEKFLVAHGKNSGAALAEAFSNIDDSKKSSLGLYIGGDTYTGQHGKSLHLHGLEASNSNAMFRDIVIHAANYVSYDFIKTRGRLGRSWGCPAVSPGVIARVISTMQNGSVIYGYHKDLMTSTLKNPALQTVTTSKDTADKRDLPGEEEDLKNKQKAAAPVAAKPTAETKAEAKPTADKTATPAPAEKTAEPVKAEETSKPAETAKPEAPVIPKLAVEIKPATPVAVKPAAEVKPETKPKTSDAVKPAAPVAAKPEAKATTPVAAKPATPVVATKPTVEAKPAAVVAAKPTAAPVAAAKPAAPDVAKPAAPVVTKPAAPKAETKKSESEVDNSLSAKLYRYFHQ